MNDVASRFWSKVEQTDTCWNWLAARSSNARKLVCDNGHGFTDENTRVKRDGSRQCKRCHADEEQRRRARKNGSHLGVN